MARIDRSRGFSSAVDPADRTSAADVDVDGDDDDDKGGGATWSPPSLVDEGARRLSLRRVLSRVLDEAPEPVRVGRFALLERVGVGGMGVVYVAHDPDLDRRVALKLLRGDRRSPSARLLREAQALARLSHPNVVAVHEVGVHEGEVFMAMEFIEGETLAAWLTTPRSPAEILAAFVDAGRGLAAAHAAGLVHRDFKPSNVLVGGDGRVRVSDFGLVRLLVGGEVQATAPGEGDEAASSSSALTMTGAVVGTPGYMSPEQFESRFIGAASDQFSFCVALYEALYGQRPFEGETLDALAEAVCGGARRPTPRRRGVPARVGAAIERGLSVEPGDRFVDMDALLRAIEPARPRRRWLVGVAVGAALSAGALGLIPDPEPCAIDASLLAGLWGSGRRDALRRSLAAVDGERAAATAVEALDAWTSTWLQGQRDACVDGHVRGRHSLEVLDLRTACLERLRGDFAALTEVLEAGTGRVESIPALLEGLPAVRRCANLEMLQQGPRPPADADAARAVVAAIGRGHALRLAGRGAEAKVVAAEALTAAEALGDRATVADAIFLRGLLRGDAGERAAGVADIEEAATIAEGQRHDLRVAEARVELALVLGQRGESAEERRRWFPLARAAVERLGDRSDPLRATMAFADAAALEAEERWEEALPAYDAAIELGARSWPAGDDRLLRLALRRAIVAGRLGRKAEAAAGFESAAASILRRWGPEHRWYANTLFDRGQFEVEQLGELERGTRRIGEALAIYRGLPGADVEVGWSLVALAQAAYLQGDYAEAEARAREGLGVLEGALGPEHPDVLIVVDNLGAVLFRRGELAAARAAFTRALEAQRRRLGDEHPEVARLESHVGEVLLAEGEPGAALERFLRAEASLRAQRGAGHLDLLVPLKGLGLGRLALGELASARAAFDRAREVLEANPGADPAERAEVLWGLARALDGLGEPGEVPALAAAAESAFAAVDDPRAAAVAAWAAER
ncbi:MAG: serine/threonine protein kinase [Myxococcales bacterium]|nr:serine/threonine protein kinase [Myxococcales bacterium]